MVYKLNKTPVILIMMSILVAFVSVYIGNFYDFTSIIILFFIFIMLLVGLISNDGFIPLLFIVLLIPRTFDEKHGLVIASKFFTGLWGAEVHVVKGLYIVDCLFFTYFFLLLCKSFYKPVQSNYKNLFFPFSILFGSILIVSFFINYYQNSPLDFILGSIIEYFRLIILLYILYKNINIMKINIYIRYIVYITLILNIIALFRWLLGSAIDGERIATMGLGINAFATFNCMVLPIIFSRLVTIGRKGVEYYILVLTLILTTIGTLLTGSRQGILGIIVFIITFMILTNKEQKLFRSWRACLVFTFFITGIILMFLIPYMYEYSGTYNFKRLSMVTEMFTDPKRLALLDLIFKIDYLSFLFGNGPGSFNRIWVENMPSYLEMYFSYYWHPHNLFEMIFLELGAFALILFLIIIFKLIFNGFKVLNKNPYHIGLLSSLIVFIIIEQVDYLLWDYKIMFLFSLILVALHKLNCLEKPSLN